MNTNLVRLTRKRMAESGEPYNIARRAVLADFHAKSTATKPYTAIPSSSKTAFSNAALSDVLAQFAQLSEPATAAMQIDEAFASAALAPADQAHSLMAAFTELRDLDANFAAGAALGADLVSANIQLAGDYAENYASMTEALGASPAGVTALEELVQLGGAATAAMQIDEAFASAVLNPDQDFLLSVIEGCGAEIESPAEISLVGCVPDLFESSLAPACIEAYGALAAAPTSMVQALHDYGLGTRVTGSMATSMSDHIPQIRVPDGSFLTAIERLEAVARSIAESRDDILAVAELARTSRRRKP